MKKELGFKLLIAVIAGVAVLQLFFIFVTSSLSIFNTFAETTKYVTTIFYALFYFVLTILIWTEIEHLEEFRIDKFALLSFILGSIFRRRLGVVGEEYFLIFIGLMGVLTAAAWVIKKPLIVKTDMRWAVVGIILASVLLIPICWAEYHLRTTWVLPALFKDSIWLTATREINYQFSFAAILEEFMFRGFLWGYLKRMGWQERNIFLAQGGLFWILHIGKFFQAPFTFLLILPVTTYIFSILAVKSKQIFPSVLAHVVINAVGAVLNLATF